MKITYRDGWAETFWFASRVVFDDLEAYVVEEDGRHIHLAGDVAEIEAV
jgi:hypothetical protein